MKKLSLTAFALLFILSGCKKEPEKFNGLDLDMGNLYRVSDAQTRSVSPENLTGEKGKGGMATLEEGIQGKAARELGQGWKVDPYIRIAPGEEVTLAEIEGEGAIQHIWMTTGNKRLTIIRFYWDDEKEPSVEVPVGDFFASGWGPSCVPKSSLRQCA